MTKYNLKNREKIKEYHKLYYLKNKEKFNEQSHNYYINNKDKLNNWTKNYNKQKRKTDINFRIKCNLRVRLNLAVKNKIKIGQTMELVGCSIENLKQHLQSKFTNGMCWDNYGKWHIDHIVPCVNFNLAIAEEQKKCFNYTNLQPLWAVDNIRKYNKVI